jgi:hypothetical protein
MLAVGLFFLLAAQSGFTQETDPVPGLKSAIKDQTGIDLLPCPEEQATRFLEQDYQPYCGTTRPGFIEFRKLWKKALKKHPKLTYDPIWEPLPDDLIRGKFWYRAKPGFVLFNEKTGFLLIGMDLSFMDCASLRYRDPDFADGALLPGIGGASSPERINWVRINWAPPEIPHRGSVRHESSVVLQMIVDRTGVPTHTCILDVYQPNTAFMAAALTALKQWRYMPAMKDGKPVKVLLTARISYGM